MQSSHFVRFSILTAALVTFNVKWCSAITCYKCDSVTLPSCATSLDSNSLPYEECKSAFACAMTIVDSVTYRGCSTNTPRGPDYYKTCSENLCNKGVYPPGRLKCHQCGGKDCLAAPTTKPTPCLYFYETDHCYIDVIDEEEAYRGCYSDKNRIVNILSELCEINGCNDTPGMTTLTCSKCDSSDARGCKMDLFEVNSDSCLITNGTTCSEKMLLGHDIETCFLYHNLNRVVRGCSSESGTLSLDIEHFDTCDTELCNKKCLKQQKCIICDSTKDERCMSDPSSLTASTCPSAEASSCHACKLADETVQRGCGVPSGTAGSACNQCQDEGCNKLPFTKCYKCTSDESPNCGQWANSNIIDQENCEIAGAKCVSAVFTNGKTLRGCEGPQLTCNGTQQTYCTTCSGDLCNSGVYPALRLQCHHCDGRNECSDVVDEKHLRPCAKYDIDDACFEFVSGRGTMVRGCRSDSALYYECLLVGGKCRLCDGPGCNMMPVNQTATLKCHKCSAVNETCSWQQGDDSLVECQSNVTHMSSETCYTRHYTNGSTSRGCTLDEDITNDYSGDYILSGTCLLDGCNQRAMIMQHCIQCQDNGTDHNACATRFATANGVMCNQGLVTYEQRGCYTKINGSYIERGCAVDISTAELTKCKNDNTCHYCQGVVCNIYTPLDFEGFKNGCFITKASPLGLLILAVLLKLF